MYPTNYYQVGGFGAQGGNSLYAQFRYDLDALAGAIAGPKSPLRYQISKKYEDSAELILGIEPNGASYVLLSESQMSIIRREHRHGQSQRPRRATEFLSLSPIAFPGAKELRDKLKAYLPKPKKRNQEERYDSSKANKGYCLTPSAEGGIRRAAFEHQRILFKVLRDDIELKKFALPEADWKGNVRVFALAFNTWKGDLRPQTERMKEPKVLDLGWTEMSVEDMSAKQGTTNHVIVVENHLLRNQHLTKLDFSFGETKQLGRDALSQSLRETFESVQQGPAVLLVQNEEIVRNIMRMNGLDVSKWESGISSLLGYSNANRRDQYEYAGSSRRYDRSRSRSPQRDQPRGQYDYKPPHSLEYSQRSRAHASFHIVDVSALHSTFTKTDVFKGLVANIAKQLGIYVDHTGWCAGNECHLLVDIWRTLAVGPPVDERRALPPVASTTLTDAEVDEVKPPLSDDDIDPNDIQPAPQPLRGVQMGFGEDDDSDDEW